MGCFQSSDESPVITSKNSGLRSEANKYTCEDLTALYERFHEEHPNRIITKADLIDLYQKQYPNGNAEQFANQMFKLFDANDDGVIDYKEFMIGLGLFNDENLRLKLRWVFELFDEDKNGVITLDEVIKFYRVVHIMVPDVNGSPEKRAKKLFKKMDKAKDGRIHVSEFIEAVMENPACIYSLKSL